jgi:HD-GYP domain-containing protein (c-di-GMP phosphodiesterase class II)
MRRDAVRSLRARAAEKLLEPELTRYPELRRHSQEVAARTESFARFLGLNAAECETLGLAATVHDVGMRMLDYERLYRKKDLSPDELNILREHASVGAVMVEPLLGLDVARTVLCHHERVDGRGYPNELHGDEIPLASRVLQICDAWVAMTDLDSYQPAEPAEGALSIITRGAGSQFDSDLARKFAEMMRKR